MTTNEDWDRVCAREEAEYDPFQDERPEKNDWDIVPQKPANNSQPRQRRQDNHTSAASSKSGDSKKDLGKLSERECGAVWNKIDQKGNQYFKGKITIDGEKTDITILPNLNPDELKNTPHWRLYWS
jgi:uncharacterized protein (DUF736 family)